MLTNPKKQQAGVFLALRRWKQQSQEFKVTHCKFNASLVYKKPHQRTEKQREKDKGEEGEEKKENPRL